MSGIEVQRCPICGKPSEPGGICDECYDYDNTENDFELDLGDMDFDDLDEEEDSDD